MEFRFRNKFLVVGDQPARMVHSNNRDVEALLWDCDPEPLVRLYSHSERWFGQGAGLTGLVYLNGMEALLAAGQETTVIKMIEPLLKDPRTANSGASCSFYYLKLSQALTQQEDWAEAIEAQNKAMSYFNQLRKKEQQGLSWELGLNGYTLQLHNGEMVGLEEKCLGLLNAAPTPKGQMEAHLLLGKLYLALHRDREAETHLTYAAEKGNKLLVQKEADLLLAQLRKDPLTKEQRIFGAQRACAKGRYSEAVGFCEKAYPWNDFDSEKETLNLVYFPSALLNLGRFEESLEQLEKIEPLFLTSGSEELRLIHFYNKALAYMGLNRLDEATEAQNRAVAIFEENNLEAYRHQLCRSGLQLNIKRGNLDGLEEQINALLEKASEGFEKMADHMTKAQYLLAAGRSQEARPHLEYVVKHGGEHHFVREAQAALESL